MKINNHIILDFNKTKQVDTQTIQCDMNSRFVRVSLRHNNSPIDLSDVRVCIMAVKPDGKEIFNDCTVIDAQNGIAEFEITKQMGIVVGEVECQIKLFSKEKLLSSNIFNLSVNKSLYPDSQDSKDQLNTLVDSLNRVDEWDDQFEQKYNGLEQEYAHDITEIKGLMAITPTVHDFIDETIIVENDIVDRVDGVEQEIVKTNAQLSHEINKRSASLSDMTVLSLINAVERVKNGGTVIIPNGYEIETEDTIVFENLKNVTFSGSGSNKIKIKEGKKIPAFEFLNCQNVIIENICFDAQGELESITDFGNYMIVYGEGSTDLTVENCVFKNITDVAILDRQQQFATSGSAVKTKLANTIINNNRFINCKHSYLTKGGGAKNIIYTNNIHKDCYTGVKLDGEVMYNDEFNDGNGYSGNVVISNNIFNNIGGALCKGAGLNCIMVEERVHNVTITGNVIDGADYVNAIAVNTGQTASHTENINITNNIITKVTNGYGLHIGEYGSVVGNNDAYHNTLRVNGNTFKDLMCSAVVVSMVNISLTNFDLSGNKFVRCSYSCSSTGLWEGVVNIKANVKDAVISNNIFDLVLNANNKMQLAIFDQWRDNHYIITNNIFKSKRTGGGADDFDEYIQFEGCVDVRFYNNEVERCVVIIKGSNVDLMNNYFKNSVIRISTHSNQKSLVKSIKNIYHQNETSSAYYMRIDDGNTNHVIIDDVKSISHTSGDVGVYRPNGDFVEVLS